MKAFLALTLLALVAAVSAGCGKGKGEKGGRWKKMMECNGEKAVIDMEEHKKHAEDCKAKSKEAAGDDKRKKWGLFMICMAQEAKVLNGNTVDTEKLKEHFTKMFPENGAKINTEVVDVCCTPDNLKDLDAEKPETFKAVAMCMKEHYSKTCNIKMGGRRGGGGGGGSCGGGSCGAGDD